MKKLFAILCVLAMLCMLCVPAFAVEGVTSLAIVGTGIPGVGDWDPANAAGEMEEVEAGIFVKEITLAADSTMTFKFAANDNWDVNFGGATVVADEAVAMTQGGGDMIVSVNKETTLKFTVDVNGDSATMLVEGDGIVGAPEAPATLETLYIVGSGIPGVGDWNPSDEAGLLEEVEDGIFVKELTLAAGTSMQFKFAGNGSWNSGFNFGTASIVLGEACDMMNDGGSSNMTLDAAEEMTVKITVDTTALADGGNATILVEEVEVEDPVVDPTTPSEEVTEPSEEVTEPSEEVTEPSEEVTEPSEEVTEPSEEITEPSEDPSVPAEDDGMVTVYAKVPASWGGANCWAWSGSTNAFESWPGNAMTLEGDWYTIQIPNWVDSIIVNWEGDANKTPDTAIEAGKDVWLVVADDNTATPYYEEPSVEDMPTTPADPAPSEPAGDDTTAGTDATTQPTEDPEAAAKLEAEKTAKRNRTLIILGISLLVIVGIACVLSIPKKIT